MASSSSGSPEPGAGATLTYAGFWKRTLATLLDVVILLAISVPLVLAIYGRDYLRLASERGGFAGVWDFVIQVVLPAVAVIIFWRLRGATPGKILLSVRIVDEKTGGAPRTSQLIGRYFAYVVSTLPFFLGFLWIAFDRRKQGFHDKLAGTMVIQDDD